MKKTPLYNEHLKLGAKMVPFGGWEMPVQYAGLMEEHNAVRNSAGLFDVSHMGEFEFTGPDTLPFLDFLTANDVAKLADGQAQYSLLCNKNGGIVDDILVYRHSETRCVMVVNAGNIEKDWNWVRQILKESEYSKVAAENISDRVALIACQGPKSVELLDFADLKTFRFKTVGSRTIARTGYTGEDGVEIFCPAEEAARLWQELLAKGATPCGLGARDTLRLEARLSLYGHEITDETNPFEAGLSWVVKMGKKNFVGRAALEKIGEAGFSRRLAGFQMIDKGIPREGYKIFPVDREPTRGGTGGSEAIGFVTSGTFSPTLKKAIGLAYLPAQKTEIGTKFCVDIRGSQKLAEVIATPFYKRGCRTK